METKEPWTYADEDIADHGGSCRPWGSIWILRKIESGGGVVGSCDPMGQKVPGARIRWWLQLWAEPIVGGKLGRTCSDGFDKGEEGIQEGSWVSGLNNSRE